MQRQIIKKNQLVIISPEKNLNYTINLNEKAKSIHLVEN